MDNAHPATDLAVHPSPVLTEAVLKVEQVVARLQGLQTTISGLHLSPVNPKRTRSSRTNGSYNRVFCSSKDCPAAKDGAGTSRYRGECRRSSIKDYKAGSKPQPDQTLASTAGWNQWPVPANQVHDVISEILMASQFAKQIATLVAEALQEGPQKTQKSPADQVQEPKRRVTCREGKRKDIPFPSKAQLQKTMSAKAPPLKPVNKFKVAFKPSDDNVKLARTAGQLSSRPKSPPPLKSGPAVSSSKRRISRLPNPEHSSPRSPLLVAYSPAKKRRSQRLFTSPESRFRDSGDADDELSYPKRSAAKSKPWKLTPTKPGLLFSNPVYLRRSPTKTSAPRPSPVKAVTSTSGRRATQQPNSPEPKSSTLRRRSNVSANPLASSFSKVTFKREGSTKSDLAGGPSKRELHRTRKPAVEIVPLKSTTTMFEVLKLRSPPRPPAESPTRPPRRASRRLMPLDANIGSLNITDRPGAVTVNEPAKELRSSNSHPHAKPDPHVPNMTGKHEEILALSGVVEPSDKENAPVPSCAPAVMFLRSMSNAHTFNRTLSRKTSAGSLLRRAKGWMSSQAVRHGTRSLELER